MKIRTLFTLLICLCNIIAKSQESYSKEIKQQGERLYQSFTNLQMRSGLLELDDTARLKWNNLPVGMRARAGTSIGKMTEAQRRMVHQLLAASLSSQGYLKTTSIMHLDNLIVARIDSMLRKKVIDEEMAQNLRNLNWGHQNFCFAFFGKPTDPVWGYKLEGHHLSINFTISGEQVATTPMFLGSSPAEFQEDIYAGWRILGEEEDLGLSIINGLPKALQALATKDTATPADIITSAESGIRLQPNWGLKTADMPKAQQEMVGRLVREFVFNLEWEKANTEYAKIVAAGLGEIFFGWIGSYEENRPYYYILNGPTFLIEFDNIGGGANREANHIHAIWREKGNEFGEDLLKKHYELHRHQ